MPLANDTLLRALRREPTPWVPVWLMRQAGRYLPEYVALRARAGSFMALATTPSLAAEVTLQPLARFPLDAAILFSDILTVPDAMGLGLSFAEGEGPRFQRKAADERAIGALTVPDPAKLRYVFDAVREIKRALRGSVPLIGFAGSPFTLACYMIEGRPSRDYGLAKGLMFSDEPTWHALMEKVTDQVIRYLQAQVKAGIQIAQLFDSWVGILSPPDYERYVLPHSRRIFEALRGTNVPTIHFGTGNASFLEAFAGAGSDAVSVDWRVPLDVAWERIGHDKAIQGNLDPVLVLTPWQRLEEGVQDVLRRAAGRPGHIFNLGHGVLKETDPDQLTRIVETVHTKTAQ
jgi:uroporphyrinogen decarboxylase